MFSASSKAAGSQPTFGIVCCRWPWCVITGIRTIVTSFLPPWSALIQKQWSPDFPPFHSSSMSVVTLWLISLSQKLLWPHINSLQNRHRREHAGIYLTQRLTDFSITFLFCKCPFPRPDYGGLRKESLGVFHSCEGGEEGSGTAPLVTMLLLVFWELQIPESGHVDSFHRLNHSIMMGSCRRRNCLSEGAFGQGIKECTTLVDCLPQLSWSSILGVGGRGGIRAHAWLSFWKQVKCLLKSTVQRPKEPRH